MVAGGLPTVQVLLDDGTGTFPYDISNTARTGYSVSRGRQDEMSQVTAGQLTLTLDNTDGRFTPGSTVIASPSPIKVDQRIRVKVTANAVTLNRFAGYVQQWPVAWPDGSDLESLVTMLAADGQARAERWVFAQTFPEWVASSVGGSAYSLFPLDSGPYGTPTDANPTAPYALAQSAAGAPLTYALPIGTLGATTFTDASTFYTDPTGILSGGAGGTDAIGFVIQVNQAPAATFRVLSFNGKGPAVQAGTGFIGESFSGVYSTTNVADGLPHVVVWEYAAGKITVDGALVVTGGATLPASSFLTIGALSGTGSTMLLSCLHSGLAANAAAAYQAYVGWPGEAGTTRLTRVANLSNLPIGTLDPSLTNLAAMTQDGGQTAQGVFNDVAVAEMGLLFFDGGGNLTFHNRNRPALKTAPDITVAADVLDPGTAFTVDLQGILNYFEVTATGSGGKQIIRNTTSESTHGRYPGSATYAVQTDSEATDRGKWVVVTHAEPAPRVGSLTIDLLSLDAATQSSLLGAEPNTWIRVTGLPSQTPGGTTADLMVQGFSEALTKDSWSITFNVVNRSLYTALILDNATFGVLDSAVARLYV
jgi:hypothetical protein